MKMGQEVKVKEMLEIVRGAQAVLVDVRSPAEFADMTIPGSINVPIFDNEERAEIGTLYKQVSVEAAKDRALEIVSAKLPGFIRSFQKLGSPIIVFCWRGGMRSKTTVTLLELMGIRAERLQGGVKAHRRWVIEQLEMLDIRPDSFILNGGTGSGKTAILRQLKERGVPSLDLEGLASHRGSIFGQIGLQPTNQKMFEAALVHEMLNLQEAPYLVFEAESKRMGKILLPESIMNKKRESIHIFIELPLEVRVQNILDEYKPAAHHQVCIEAFEKIKRRIHTPVATEIQELLDGKDYALAVQLLLEHYYDPRYLHSEKEYEHCRKVTIQAKDIEDAVKKVAAFLEKQPVPFF